MKTYLFILLLFFIACSNMSQKTIKNNEFDNCVDVDTICNFKICREKQYITLDDSLRLQFNEKVLAIVQLKNDSIGTIKGWKLDLFRVYRNDSIISNYPKSADYEIPQNIDAYLTLIDSYIKTVKLYPINLNIESNAGCHIGLGVKFINSESKK
jgi:hypothetical protein